MSAILPVKAPMSIIASVTAVSTTAVSNGYLQGRPLPHFSSNCSSALGNNWGLASKGISSANLTGSCGLTKSYRFSK